MYSNKMALAVKVPARNKSSVAREVDDTVFLPFGCEYSLMLKNLNSVKATVRIWIDGTDVADGGSYVIYPHQTLDLERFMKSGNMDAGNKFKFIERTAAVSEHRGNKIDDGLIRVEFEFEKPYVPPAWINQVTWPSRDPYLDLISNQSFADQTTYGSGVMGNNVPCSTGSVVRSKSKSLKSPSVSTSITDTSCVVQSEVGITVEGSVSDQKFQHAAWFATDGVKHVMVLRVLGEVEGEPVKAPITVKTKTSCPNCGTSNKAGTKFCSECGTGLQIV